MVVEGARQCMARRGLLKPLSGLKPVSAPSAVAIGIESECCDASGGGLSPPSCEEKEEGGEGVKRQCSWERKSVKS